MTDTAQKHEPKWWRRAILFPLLPLILVVALLALVLFIVTSISLHVIIWSWWCLRGRNILFVYSNSPIWHDHVEQHIVPHLGERAVVLNWSERKRWRISLARIVFHHFGGDRQFNPLGLVFRPFRCTRTFRFWQPFQDFKHGNPVALGPDPKSFHAAATVGCLP